MKKGKIRDFCTVIAGQSPQGSSYNEKGVGMEFHQGKKAFGETLLEHSNVWTTEITKVAEEGDILMSVRAPVGPTNMTDRKICIGRGLAAIRCTDSVIPRYVLYALRNIENKIVGNDGAVFNSINKKMIEDLPLPNINLDTQRRIVSRLDSAFSHIDELKAKAEKQLSEAKALFQKALAEEMKPKEGWEEDSLVNVFNFIDYRGATPTKIKDGVPLVTAKNVKYGYIDYTIKEYISRDEFEKRKNRGISNKGDILFTTEAPLGNVAIADLDEFSAGQRLITLQQYAISRHVIENKFYFYYMLSPRFQNRIKDWATGATAQGIKAKILKTIIVPIPPLSDQHSIVTRLDALSSRVRQLEENCRKTLAECDALKQAMLREVFE